jgi:purine-binding chemotaxis protein CheW
MSAAQQIEARQVCTFLVGGLYYGIDVRGVQEVIRFQDMTRVPLAPGHVRGLINLRGQIVTAIDMRARLCLAERRADELPMNVVVRGEEGGVSLLVDEIGDVVDVSNEAFEAPPETVPATSRAVLRGVFKMQGRLLLELDTDRLVNGCATEEP